MFTGLIEETGTVSRVKKGHKSARITIDATLVLEDIHLGDSIAVNGICLTVTDFTRGSFTVDVMPETMSRTNLSGLIVQSKVHLERAMKVGSRFGGHIVSGHIDGLGTIRSFTKEDNATRLTVEIDSKLRRYMIEKGSVAIDGVSLTITKVESQWFQVGIIPMTGQETLLLQKMVGDLVNIECDVIGKYVEQLCRLQDGIQKPTMTEEYLRNNGFYNE